MIAAAIRWALAHEASTRTAALLRICLVPVLWSRWAAELAPHRVGGSALALVGLVFYAATALLLVGLWTRLAAAVVAAVVLVLVYGHGLLLGRPDWLHHHTYLLAVVSLLLAATPCGRSLSLDRWRALRRAARGGPPAPRERANLWGMRLIALQLAALYAWSAVDKLTPGFLSGDRLEAILLVTYFDHGLRAAPWLHLAALAGAWLTVLAELVLGPGLLHPRARRYLLVPGLLLHAAFYVLLPVSTFSVTAACMYWAVLDADRVHAAIDALLAPPSTAPPA
ncbi:MAG: HTTM domain-containing protein [Myxococcales bacterium]|nr:HTTM domain-containing protein [Myxococcales bacterium]